MFERKKSVGKIYFLPIDQIHPSPFQARRTFEEQELAGLAQSIRENGLLQPISVRKAAEGYELVAGERRLRACKLAQMTTIPAILCSYADEQTAALGLLENIQRTDLNPFEQAQGLRDILVLWDCTQAEAAKRLGMAQPTLANKLRLLTGTESHQGVAAFASEIEYVTVEDLLNAAREKGEPPFLVLSDGIEDPHNLGAVMRSALLCGAHGIVIPKRGGASVTPTVIKSSAGAAERLPVARVANIGETIRRLKDQGVFVYCADMDGVPLRKNNLTGPIALVLGSEGSGVSQLVKKLCDGVVRLDMAAQGTGVDSFNVSVAAGIILYEIQSQRAAE